MLGPRGRLRAFGPRAHRDEGLSRTRRQIAFSEGDILDFQGEIEDVPSSRILPAPDGFGPGFRRPVLIVQANEFNASRISTVVCAVITSNLRAEAPGKLRLDRHESRLRKASVVDVSQIVTLGMARLTRRVTALPAADTGSRLVLAF